MENRFVAVRVPATTANLGPGFDCLGMALDWWNDVCISTAPRSAVSITGDGASSLSESEDNLVYRAARVAFDAAGEEPGPLSISCRNRIPLARGLGSSAAAIVGGLVAANALCSRPLDRECLLALAVEMEGHGDNVAPALLGGCRIVARDEGRIVTDSVPFAPALMAVVYVPDIPMATAEARAVLPEMVSRQEAVYNLGRTALLVNGLSTGRMDMLKVATQDRLHQPARQDIFPAMKYIIRAALDAGAVGAFLSGGGSSVLALATSRAMTIGYEMANAADKVGVSGDLRVTRPTTLGAHVVSTE